MSSSPAFIISGSDTEFTPAPEGTYPGRCYKLIEAGHVAGKFGIKPLLILGWELYSDDMIDGKPFVVQRRYNATLNKQSSLRKDLERWRGKKFTEDDLKGFDIKVLLGQPCLLTISHNEREGNVFANVDAVVRCPKEITVAPLVNKPIEYSVKYHDAEVFAALTDGTKALIEQSQEWTQGIVQQPTAPATAPSGGISDEFDDDVPW